MTRKIALTSTGPLSGKTALAKHLEREYGFTWANHSRSLVEDFVWEYNVSWVSTNLTVEDVYADKECWRPQLQDFGYRVGYNNENVARSFILRTLERAGATPDTDVVYEPFRGELQASILREMGFTLVQLHIPEDTRRQRADALGVSYSQIVQSMSRSPELERGIARPDIKLVATMPVGTIARFLMGDQEIRSYIRG